MRILVLRSQRRDPEAGRKEPYTQTFGSRYAERVTGNLVGEDDFCTACGPDCVACRKPYHRRFGADIAGVISFPAVLPYLLERPAEHVPSDLPPHDILLAINIHEQILVETIRRCGALGTRAAVVPLEASDWVSGSAREQAGDLCDRMGIELAFPKPFCSFDPPAGTVLAEFRRRFHIGKPDVRLDIRGGIIRKADVGVSAACGATYYVARWLVGRRVDEDLRHEIVSKRMHSYPCTASMKWDDELGDTPLHVAGQAHYEILRPIEHRARSEPALVMSPLGTMVQKPIPPKENIQTIEKAKQTILSELAGQESVSLRVLREKPGISAAALHTALLLLKQEGKIRAEGRKIVRGDEP